MQISKTDLKAENGGSLSAEPNLVNATAETPIVSGRPEDAGHVSQKGGEPQRMPIQAKWLIRAARRCRAETAPRRCLNHARLTR